MNNIFENKNKVQHIWNDTNLTTYEKFVAVYLILEGGQKPPFQQAFELGLTEASLKLYKESLNKKKVKLDV